MVNKVLFGWNMEHKLTLSLCVVVCGGGVVVCGGGVVVCGGGVVVCGGDVVRCGGV